MKLLVVFSAVMACAMARPGLSYSSWALPGGLVAAPVAPAFASPIAPTLAVRSYSAPVVAASPAFAAYSAIPAFAPFSTPVAAPAAVTAKSEAPVPAPAPASAETASDDAVAVEAAPADSPAPVESSAPVVAPAPAPVEETPAPDAPAPAPAPVAPVQSVAAPVPAWAPAVASAPVFAAPAPVAVAAPAPVAVHAPAHVAVAAPAHVAVATPVIKSQYHAQDELGNTAYGHAEPGSVHSAVQDAAGNRVGSFSYLNPTDGQVHRTDYVADGMGYRVAANDLPVGPAAPIADTPEVAAARAAHLAAHSRARRSLLTTPASTAPLATPVVARVAAPVAYAAPLAYASPVAAPLAYTAPVAAAPYAAHFGLPATLTTVVNNPGHAVSYRID